MPQAGQPVSAIVLIIPIAATGLPLADVLLKVRTPPKASNDQIPHLSGDQPAQVARQLNIPD